MKAFLAAVVMGWLALGCEKSTVDAPQQAVAVPKQVSPVKCQLAEKWDNFRGIKWGANVSSISGMIPVKVSSLMDIAGGEVFDIDSVKLYRREGDKLTIGKAELEQIIYGFYEGQFCYLRIETNGMSDYLKEAIFAKYGEGYQANYSTGVGWFWYLAGGLNMDLDHKGLVMKYTPIYADAVKKSASLGIEKAKKRGEEAAKDF